MIKPKNPVLIDYMRACSRLGHAASDASDALAYNMPVVADIKANEAIDKFIDWDRLKNNGACTYTFEDRMALNSIESRILMRRFERLPYDVTLSHDPYSCISTLQRVHRSSAWTGRMEKQAGYIYCDACGHIGRYQVNPAFCPECFTSQTKYWPPRFFMRLIGLLNELIVLKK